MQTLNNYFLVFVGGGIGACLRHACNLIGARVAVGSPWPWSTFLINVSGALLMGVVVEVFAMRNGASPQLRLLLATGILGGYTTFSTYALEIGLLLQRGQHGLAALVCRRLGGTGPGRPVRWDEAGPAGARLTLRPHWHGPVPAIPAATARCAP